MNTQAIRAFGWSVLVLGSLCTSRCHAQPDLNVQPKRDNPVAGGNLPAGVVRRGNQTPVVLRIKDVDGEPLRRRSISVRFSAVHGMMGSHSYSGQQTDDNGISRGMLLTEGHYAVYLRVEGAGVVYRDDITVVAARNIAAAENAPIDLQLQTGSALEVTVRETNGRKLALGGAQILLSYYLPVERLPAADQRGSLLQAGGASTRDGDGLALVNHLYPGRYQVRVQGPQGFAAVSQDVEIKNGETTKLSISAERETLVACLMKVRLENGEPLKNETVSFALRPSTGEPIFSRVSYGFALGSPFSAYNRTAKTDDKGEFMLYPVAPGSYQLMPNMVVQRDGNNEIIGPNWQITANELIVPAEGGEVIVTAHPRPVLRMEGRRQR